MDEPRPWHRLFGLSWMDFFHGLPVTVDLERDLSVKKQLLDVILILKEAAHLSCRLPEGFEDLARFNLVTFKSYQEKLSVWALLELIGHYVNLRKQESRSMDEDELLAEDQFRLFAVTARYPQQLASQNVPLEPISEGVYDLAILTRRIRVIVANQLPQEEHNVLLHRFSTNPELLTYAARHSQVRSAQTSTLLVEFFKRYQQEALLMPNMLEEFARQTIDQLLKELPVEKRLEGLSAEERLKGLPAEERLKGLSAEDLAKGLSPEMLRAALAEKLKGNGATVKPE